MKVSVVTGFKPLQISCKAPQQFGPDRFSRFDFYWIQTKRHPDKLNLYIESNLVEIYAQKGRYQDQDILNLKKKEPRTSTHLICIVLNFKFNVKRNCQLSS